MPKLLTTDKKDDSADTGGGFSAYNIPTDQLKIGIQQVTVMQKLGPVLKS